MKNSAKLKVMKIEYINFSPDKSQRDYVYPMLGIPILAALTPDDYKIEMTFLDKNEAFQVKDVDIVAMSVLTHHAPYAYKIADEYRRNNIKVILGGIHPSVLPDEACKYSDSVVIGEAELIWNILLEDLKNDRLKPIYKSNQYVSPELIPNSRIDLMRNPIFHNCAVLHASRGCPFDCSFCSVTKFFGNTYRFRPIKSVIEEVEYFLESGISGNRNIIFNDDNIACNKKYARELFTELKKLNITWSSQANLFIGDDTELLKLAADSGCISLFVGIESISEANLKGIKKTMNSISKYENAIKRIHDSGIVIIASFIFGLDNDTEDIFDKTLEFIAGNEIEMPSFSVLTPFPGTAVFDELQSEKRIIDTNWSNYDMGNVVYLPKLMSPEKLQDKMNYLYNATAFRRSRGVNRIKNRAVLKI